MGGRGKQEFFKSLRGQARRQTGLDTAARDRTGLFQSLCSLLTFHQGLEGENTALFNSHNNTFLKLSLKQRPISLWVTGFLTLAALESPGKLLKNTNGNALFPNN